MFWGGGGGCINCSLMMSSFANSPRHFSLELIDLSLLRPVKSWETAQPSPFGLPEELKEGGSSLVVFEERIHVFCSFFF